MPIQGRHGWINSGTSTHSREQCHSEKEGGWVLLTDREWFPGIIAEWKRSKYKEYPRYTTSCVRRKGKWEDALAPPNWCKKKHRRDKSETNELGYLQGWAGKDQKGRKRLEGWVQGWGRDTSQRISFCRVVTFGRMLMFPMGKKKSSRRREKPQSGTWTVTNELTPFQMNQMTTLKGEEEMSPNNLNTGFGWYPSQYRQK